MIYKKKIVLDVLNSYKEPFDKNDDRVKLLAIFSENFEDIADSIVKKLTIPVVSNFVIQEIERRRDIIISEPDGIVREQMINNIALEL